MKKTLMSLLAGCLTLSSLAGPQELHKKMLKGMDGEYNMRGDLIKERTKEYSSPQYTLEASASECQLSKNDGKNEKRLNFIFNKGSTSLDLFDYGANGIGEGDSLSLEHKFSSGEVLWVDIHYEKDADVSINSKIMVPSEKGTLEYNFEVETSQLNPALKWVIKRKIAPVTQWGKQLYGDLVASLERDVVPNLPYQDLQTALSEIEPLLPAIKNGSKGTESALIKMSSKYSALAHEKTKVKP